MAVFEGDVDNLDLFGACYFWQTPVPSTLPLVGYFLGTSITNCRFAVKTFPSPANYHYSAPAGASPTMGAIVNCDFLFDAAASPLLAYLNFSSVFTNPVFNVRFNGNSDAVTIHMTVTDVIMATGKQRYWVNGKPFGTG
jgi:hypothetical protein